MPALQLDSLLGRLRDGDDEAVFPLVRRRRRVLPIGKSTTVSLVLFVAIVIAGALLGLLR